MDSDLLRFGRPARVLVADDDAVNRKLIMEICSDEGFEVHGTVDGQKALHALQSTPFDVAILDASMPHLDGFDVCRIVRQTRELSGVRLMVVTANVDENCRDIALRLGASAFLSKPFRVYELTQRLRALVREPPARGSEVASGRDATRRQSASVLAALPSPSKMRSRLQWELDFCRSSRVPIACALIRVEDDRALAARIGRSAMDALLGGVAARLQSFAAPDRVIRAEVDEFLMFLDERDVPALASLPLVLQEEGEKSWPMGLALAVRWGAFVAAPANIDPDMVLQKLRAAVTFARRQALPGHIDCDAGTIASVHADVLPR